MGGYRRVGVGNLLKPQSVIDPTRTNTQYYDRKPKSSDIVTNVVKKNKAVMTAYNTNSRGVAWHCILIVPTPVDFIDEFGIPHNKISVIDAVHDRPWTFTEKEFKKWWDALYLEGRVSAEYLVGGKVPQH